MSILQIFSTTSYFSLSDSKYSLVFLAGMLFKTLQAADEHILVISMHLILLPVEMNKGITV